MHDVNLSTPLSLRSSFRFPIQNAEARREVVLGGLLLLIPFVGWLLNMGHRIMMVHQMMRGRPAWPAWHHPAELMKHGLITFLGMVMYYLPATMLFALAAAMNSIALAVPAAILFAAATIAIPGYMSHYCQSFDAREIFNPTRALRRCLESGPGYWKAWTIALAALALSFLGLLALGIGFLITSVWFWQVAGFSFATVMTQQHQLNTDTRK